MAAAAAAAALQRIDEEAASTDFVHEKDVDAPPLGDVPLSKRDHPGSELGTWRVEANIGVDTEVLSKMLWDPTNPARDKKDLLEIKVIEEVDENTRIVREVQDMPWPLDNREFVYVQTRRLVDGVLTFCIMSCERDDCPPPAEETKLVRGSLWAGLQATPGAGGKAKVVNTGRVDPSGEVPQPVVEVFTDRMAKFLALIQRLALGQGRRFKVVTQNGIALRTAPRSDAKASRELQKEYGDDIPGGHGLPLDEEIEAEEMDGAWPHDHAPAWVKFHVTRLTSENRSFWVPTTSADGQRPLLAAVAEGEG